MSKQKLIVLFFGILIGLAMPITAILLAYDPLHLKSLDNPEKARFSSNMRLQAATYINHLNFDSIILGNSHMENTSAKEAAQNLGGTFFNLSLSGSNLYERSIVLNRVLSKKEIKSVVLLLTADSSKRGHGGYPIDRWAKLYDNDLSNDSNIYLNTKDIACALTFSKSERCLGRVVDLDRPAAWFQDEGYYKRFGGIDHWITHFTNAQLFDSLTRVLPNAAKRSIEPLVEPNAIEKKAIDAIIKETVLKFAVQYPSTKFYCYFNPDSLLFRSIKIRHPSRGHYDYFLRRMVALTKDQKNIFLYGFDNLPFTADIANYKDLAHYRPEINSMLLQYLAKNQYRLNSENIDAYLFEFNRRSENFDLKAFNRKIQLGIEKLK